MTEKIRLGVIGCGGRPADLCERLFRQDTENRIELSAAYDPDSERTKDLFKRAGVSGAEIVADYRRITDSPDIDWVMVGSPNCYHAEQVIAAFAGNKHVFAEKPLATTIEDCQRIDNAHRDSGKLFATGFVLRYAPLYRNIRKLLDSGRIGRIISIDANENITPDHGAYIMRNWRRQTKISGPHILEKCCHDFDLLNWFCESIPSRVASFGGLDLFTPENEELLDKYRNPDGVSCFGGWNDPHAAMNAFVSDKDLMDNQVCILEYRNKIRVQFQATMANAIPERRMYISGTEGTIIGELYTGKLRVRNLADAETEILDAPGGGHGGGDDVIMAELLDSMLNATPPACSGTEGLESAVTAIALDQAAREGHVVNLEPVWRKLEK